MVKTIIVNVVATASLDQVLDFDEIRVHKEILHDSNVYGGRVAYYKIPIMEGRVSLFSSGKMISVGTKSEDRAASELEAAMNFLVAKGHVKRVKLNPEVRNLVATIDLDRSINLEELALKLKSIYEPEQFPGMIIRMREPFKATILLFASGKAVITGLKSSAQTSLVVKQLSNMLDLT